MTNKMRNIVLVTLIFPFIAANAVEAATTLTKPDIATQVQVSKAYGKLPLSFEVNQGQNDPQVKFLSRGSGYTLFLTPTEVVLTLMRNVESEIQNTDSPFQSPKSKIQNPKPEWASLRMQLVGANPLPRITGFEKLPGKSNYLIGKDPQKWHTNVPTYAKVQYHKIYPGVDLVFYGNQRQLEYDFIVAPGADPGTIRLGFKGADKISLDDKGNLILHIDNNQVIQHAPILYQEIKGVRQTISGHYVLQEKHQVGFQVAAYDDSIPLVIDPILSYASYLGGSDSDFGLAIAVDALGSSYVTGETQSIDFPTASPLQTMNGGSIDAFVTKLDPAGSAFVYSTYLGGSAIDSGSSIAVDTSGNAYISGWTDSTDFPTTTGSLQPAPGGLRDAFVAKLGPTGSGLVYSTYLGGSGEEESRGIAVDTSNNAYVIGETYSTDFPMVNLDPLQATNGGINDVFVVKLNPLGSALVYSTYLGGIDNDAGRGIAVDSFGNAYVTGTTGSNDFPTANALQPATGGLGDAFVAKLDPTGSAFVYSTYLGGSESDGGSSIAIDSSGNAYVTGITGSNDFPTANALQAAISGVGDAFVAKLGPTGSALIYSTYLGGNNIDKGHGIAVDASDNAYVTGFTDSTDFPTTNPIQSTLEGPKDAFVVKIDSAGSVLVYSTYLGGNSVDHGNGIAVDASGNAYVTGDTDSTDFPITNPLQSALGGLKDAFVAKLNPTGSTLVYSTYFGGGSFNSSGVDEGRSIAVDSIGNAYVTGLTDSIDFPTANPFQAMNSGNKDVFVAKLDSTGSTLLYSTYFGGSSFDSGNGIAVDVSGNAFVTGHTTSTDFPMANPIQPACAQPSCGDAFVTKLDPTGSVLLYSTYLGGGRIDIGNGIAVDNSGNAYVTGFTDSTDFPTINPLQPALGGFRDAFVAKLDPTGSVLLYSTYLGGSDIIVGSSVDEGRSIAVDISGNAYITGLTDSTDFPTVNPLQALSGGNADAFVAKLDPTGSTLVYSTYLGGSGLDKSNAIIVDTSNNAYVAGVTSSTDFPTKNPLQTANGGSNDAFLAKLDPTGSTLVYSTYLGGSGNEETHGIAIDTSGSAYVTGVTGSTDFPTMNPLQVANGGSKDTFVSKLDPTGSALVYSTYLGGSTIDSGIGIAVDTSGNVYVTGQTSSTDFPITNPIQPAIGGANDAFVTKLNSTGSALVYSSYLGGSGIDSGTSLDQGRGIALDSSGNVYITGLTGANNFPIANPLQAVNGGSADAFVAKMNASGSALIYSTYLGGDGFDTGNGIAVDTFGNAYVTGQTNSAGFPTANPVQATCADSSCDDAFIAKLDPTGSTLVYSTYFGGSNFDSGSSIAVDPSGNAYVTGFTDSTDFPTTNPLQSALGGFRDAFVIKLDPTGSTLYSTYLGGSNIGGSSSVDEGRGIAVDSSGNAYVTGLTDSIDFPTANPMQATNAGSTDAFVAKLSPTGSALVYSTYLGGSGLDTSNAIFVDASGNAYVTGSTNSADFPTTASLQPVFGGSNDAFLAKLDPMGSTLIYSTYLGGSSDDIGRGIAMDASGNVYVTGWTDSTDFPTANPFQDTNSGSGDPFVAKLDPTGSTLVYSTYLGGSSFDSGYAIAVGASGIAYVTGITSSDDFPRRNPLQKAFGGFEDAFVIKISDGPEIIVSIEEVSNQNILIASFGNGGDTSEELELKLWADSPDLGFFHSIVGIPTPVITLSHRELTESINNTLPDLPFPGTTIGGRLLNPVTGTIISESICTTVFCNASSNVINTSTSEAGIIVSLEEVGGQNIVRVSFINGGAISEEIELKFWIDSPDMGVVQSLVGVPTPVITLPPGPLTEALNFPLPGILTFPGTTVGGRFLNPVTGDILSESLCTDVPCN